MTRTRRCTLSAFAALLVSLGALPASHWLAPCLPPGLWCPLASSALPNFCWASARHPLTWDPPSAARAQRRASPPGLSTAARRCLIRAITAALPSARSIVIVGPNFPLLHRALPDHDACPPSARVHFCDPHAEESNKGTERVGLGKLDLS